VIHKKWEKKKTSPKKRKKSRKYLTVGEKTLPGKCKINAVKEEQVWGEKLEPPKKPWGKGRNPPSREEATNTKSRKRMKSRTGNISTQARKRALPTMYDQIKGFRPIDRGNAHRKKQSPTGDRRSMT